MQCEVPKLARAFHATRILPPNRRKVPSAKGVGRAPRARSRRSGTTTTFLCPMDGAMMRRMEMAKIERRAAHKAKARALASDLLLAPVLQRSLLPRAS